MVSLPVKPCSSRRRSNNLTDTLSRIGDMHSMSFLNDLMPWNFTPAIPTVTRQEG